MTTTALILTHHSVPNFGANLQAFATARALQARGVQPRFVDFRPRELEAKYGRSVSDAQRAVHARFIAQHLELTPPVADQVGFEALCRDMKADLYVSGSDAVFRLDPASSRADLVFPNPYWLLGATGPDGRRPIKAALAPSAMGCDFSGLATSERDGARAALEEFSLLSARDAWTAGQMAVLGVRREVKLVPDPVFSLVPLLRARPVHDKASRPYIVICTQGRKPGAWVASLTRRAEAAGFDTLAIPTPEGCIDSGTTRQMPLPLDPLDWAKAIAGAAGYVGGRFHPVVISLAAGKPVVALDMYHRHPFKRTSSKTWEIMQRFGVALACHSSLLHRFLTPGMVWAQLRYQMRRSSESHLAKADSLACEVNAWYDQIVAQAFMEVA